MRTILTIKEQNEYQLGADWLLCHQWSARGEGSSRLINNVGECVGTAKGCGYDRWGACLADFVSARFSKELVALAKKTAKGKAYKNTGFTPCPTLYGLQYNRKTGAAALDGGCGSDCVVRVLQAIGFDLVFGGEHEQSNAGKVFYTLRPLGRGTVR